VSSANLDLVRSIYAAWEQGDFGSAEWAHPEIEFVINEDLAESSWRGPAGMAEGFRGWLSAWEDFRLAADEYRELDGERVLVFSHFSGRGKTSGMALDQMHAGGTELFHILGGKVTRLAIYSDREQALADAGLPTS
jgi:hypothetical protein